MADQTKQIVLNIVPHEHIDVRGTFTELGPVIYIGHKLFPGGGVAVTLHDALSIVGSIGNIGHEMMSQMHAAAIQAEMEAKAQAVGLVHKSKN